MIEERGRCGRRMMSERSHVKTGLTMAAASALLVALSGCAEPGTGAGPTARAAQAAKGGRVFLTVDFHQGQTLRYRFTSTKKITVDWDPNATARADRVQEQTESFEMVVAYTPTEVDPYGVSTIQAVVESVKAERTGGPGTRRFSPDAVTWAKDKTFTLKVDPRGKVVDAGSLTAVIQALGKQAFRTGMATGRTKEPDMIGDFVASQWFLWDAQASVERPAEGLTVGQTWTSQLSVPTPMVMRQARNVVYRLDEVRQSPAGPVAIIKSTYTPADTAPASWPIPYAGRFQMSGTFGFLGPYEVQGLEGTGTELFDLKAGRVEQRRETYTLRLKAGLPPMGLKANPHITIEQTLTMELANKE
jgi:hypothetical protein